MQPAHEQMAERLPPAIVAERLRQISKEGWSSEHDDEHNQGEMLAAAKCYLLHGTGVALPMVGWIEPKRVGFAGYPVPRRTVIGGGFIQKPKDWPWGSRWWKPKSPSRDLERAGALCLAEIDRLRRAQSFPNTLEVCIVLDKIMVALAALAPSGESK